MAECTIAVNTPLMNLIHSLTAHKAKTHETKVNFSLIPTL